MTESKDLNKQIRENLTDEQLQDLKDFYVERLVDNMSTKDLVAYVTDDMTQFVDKQSPLDFFEEAYSYFDDYESDYGEYNEVIDEVEEEVFADTQLSLEGVF